MHILINTQKVGDLMKQGQTGLFIVFILVAIVGAGLMWVSSGGRIPGMPQVGPGKAITTITFPTAATAGGGCIAGTDNPLSLTGPISMNSGSWLLNWLVWCIRGKLYACGDPTDKRLLETLKGNTGTGLGGSAFAKQGTCMTNGNTVFYCPTAQEVVNCPNDLWRWWQTIDSFDPNSNVNTCTPPTLTCPGGCTDSDNSPPHSQQMPTAPITKDTYPDLFVRTKAVVSPAILPIVAQVKGLDPSSCAITFGGTDAVFYDCCVDAQRVSESFCLNGALLSVPITCPNGCKDGECITGCTAGTSRCKDSLNIAECNSGGSWVEQYCKTATSGAAPYCVTISSTIATCWPCRTDADCPGEKCVSGSCVSTATPTLPPPPPLPTQPGVLSCNGKDGSNDITKAGTVWGYTMSGLKIPKKDKCETRAGKATNYENYCQSGVWMQQVLKCPSGKCNADKTGCA